MSQGKKQVCLGLVGAGFIGQVAHLANYAAIAACRVVALAELRPELRARVARRYDIPRTYATHRELLEDEQVEAVVVVTARRHTGPIALDCLTAGKHLLTEKPMAGDVAHAQQLTDAANAAGVQYAVGYMKRYGDGVQRAKQLMRQFLRTGELGRVTFVRGHCFMGESYCNVDDYLRTDEPTPQDLPDWPEAPSWLPAEMHGDYAWFLNVFSHNTNLIRYFLDGTPTVRHTHLASRQGGVVVLEFQGVPVVLDVGRLTYRGWDEILEIYFEHGRIQVRTPPALLRNVPDRVEVYRGDSHEVVSPQCEWRWAFRRQAEAFIRAVRDGEPALTGGVDSLEDVRLAEAIWRVEQQRRAAECAIPYRR